MRIPRFLVIIFITLLALRAEKDACGQWKNIAPNLVSPISNAGFGYGAMQYRDGKIIAVVFGTPICVSSDEGKTWQLVKAPYQRDEPFDLDMFDMNNAIITTYSSGLFKSQDGGLTWIKTSLPNSLKSGKFLQSANDIVAGLYYSDLTVSHDGGITWNQISNFGSQNDIQVRKKDHTIFALSNGQIYFTNNEGNTWTRTSTFSQDCYNFAFDNCDSNAIYVMNEGTVSAGINLGANI